MLGELFAQRQTTDDVAKLIKVLDAKPLRKVSYTKGHIATNGRSFEVLMGTHFPNLKGWKIVIPMDKLEAFSGYLVIRWNRKD